MTPEDEVEKWRERVGLFKRQSEAQFGAWMDLWGVVGQVIERLPDGEEKSLLQRGIDEYLAADKKANQEFWQGWEAHKARWVSDSKS